ncbi:tRNA (adenosine(37)-N6)-threonylcarbamoyltransferase complex dimerization subunit type 1 TsaB [Leeuwenhoekiella marinoflava]|uniref:tRNA threonylcarbamoyladenosine biosynthesis protein TsaB n=2 Tax=Leeuwenhoekiella marinoflava TaxID=988 RepID=A0A4Q0PPE8_9FLAO|nr:tRNA (adenosine(37)-N6)-threonylcarbamoyltransferase complex dimerization subunit type 1 TsaB [Leeuwenhoekiella marinoflava]RXG31665.1 tRNA threonylcarbamoyladenosine biosynthesis protein TsaB [Leeuwenhoekiella marinoflava]SHF09372.1 tRNA threonylcarbamoyladenosine biosynthesis protein TsaB [Leeuwenhoekiella marinoflava DSM 3653]
MALILCLETTTTNCSVAIAKDGEIIGFKEDMGLDYSHAERLHAYIEEVLLQAEVAQSQLDAVAVSKGPGSYTGLRIGVSSAKGLCFALDIPLISTNTLKALALQARGEAIQNIIPVLDARRMEVYSAIYSSELEELREIQAQVIDESSFASALAKGKTVFIGNGAEKLKPIITHQNAVFQTEALPSAREMTVLAEAKHKIGDTEDVAYFEPFYLKDFLINKPKK